MVETLLLMTYTAAAGSASWLLVRLLFNDHPVWWRLAVSVALFPVLITIALTLLGVMGWLTPHTGGVAMVAAAIALCVACRGRFPVRGPEGLSPEGLSRESMIAGATLAGVILPPLARALLTGPQFFYDDYSYHAPFVAQWMLDGRISVLPFNYHAYFPFTAELFSLWFMLPMGSDTFVGIGCAYWTVGVAVTLASLAVSLGRRLEGALLAAALVSASTYVVTAALRFSANDLAGTVMVTSALVVLSGTEAVGRRRSAGVLIAGMLLGFGLAAKVTMLPAVLLLMVWIVVDARGGWKLPLRIGYAGLLALGVVIVCGYWYGHNWFLTGNPLFPGSFAIFNGPFGSHEQDQTKLVMFLLADPFGTMRDALPDLTNWPFILSLVAGAGYVSGVVLFFRKSALESRNVQVLGGMLLLTGLVLLFAFPFQPFSGRVNDPGAPLAPQSRFLILPFAIGILLASRWIVGVRGAVIASVIVITASMTGYPLAGFTAAVLAIGSWFGYSVLNRTVRFLRAHAAMMVVAVAGVLIVGSTLWQGHLERVLRMRLFSYRNAGQDLVSLWRAVEDLPLGSRVAALGVASNFPYPLFGRSFHLQPVVLDRSGAPLEPLHAIWQRDRASFEWWRSDSLGEEELSGFGSRVLSSGVTYVAVSRTSAGEWPKQARTLVPPHFTVVFRDTGGALYRVNP